MFFGLLLFGVFLNNFNVSAPFDCFLGVGAMTWSPLACGIISGKYASGVPEGSRASLKVFAP